MHGIIEENYLMKKCSDCGLLKRKTEYFFRNINQNLRKECAQCTKTNKDYTILKTKKKLKCMLNRTKKILMILRTIDKKQILIFN